MRPALLAWLLVGPVLGAGCGRSAPSQAGQAQAQQIVWEQAFGASGEPPLVEWREDDCGGPVVGARHAGVCYSGIYLRDDRALVAWRGAFHVTAYAHELMHALQWSRGVDDPDHLRPEWSQVDEAVAALTAAGL